MTENIKILLVEDNPGDALLIKEALKESTYKKALLYVAQSLEETLHYVKENISLLLTDLSLPDSDGLETIKITKKNFPDSVLIVLTGLENEEVAIESLRLGAQNYINKNEIDNRILEKTISFAIERHQIVQQLKTTERELLQSKISLEKAQEIAHVGSWMADLEKETAILSTETLRIFGLKPEEFDGKPTSFFAMVHPEDEILITNEFYDVLRDKRLFDLVHRIIRKDGKYRWVHSQAEVTFNELKQPNWITGSIQDITDKKETEIKLLNAFDELALVSNERSAILNSLPANIAVIDHEGRIVKVNEKWIKFGDENGMAETYEHIGANYIEIAENSTGIDKETGNKVAVGLKQILKGTIEIFSVEYSCHSKLEKRWFRLDLRKYNVDEKSGAIAMHIDITERKLVEDEMSLLLNNTEESFILLDKELNIVSYNNQFKNLYKNYLNLTVEKGLNILDFAQAERKEIIRDLYRRVLAGGCEESEITIPVLPGETKTFSIKYNPAKDAKSNTIGVFVTALDITDKRQSEKKLERSEARLKDAQAIALIGSWEIDMVNNILHWSDQMFTILELNKETITPSRELFLSLVHPEDAERVYKGFKDTFQTLQNASATFRITLANKTVKHVYIEWKLEFDSSGNPLRIYGIVQDVTQKKTAEALLEQRNEQLSNLSSHLQNLREKERTDIAREIHDELGQQLTSLKMDAAWIKNKTQTENPQLHQKALTMIDSVNETIKTVRRIATELRPGILDDLGLVAALEWQMEEFKQKTGLKCSIAVDTVNESFERNMNTTVFRIFQESLTNITRHAQATEVNAKLVEQGTNLILEVKDNGKGITDERLNNKTSLGLLGMKERAYILGGDLSIQRLPEGGTGVTLKIPLKEITR